MKTSLHLKLQDILIIFFKFFGHRIMDLNFDILLRNIIYSVPPNRTIIKKNVIIFTLVPMTCVPFVGIVNPEFNSSAGFYNEKSLDNRLQLCNVSSINILPIILFFRGLFFHPHSLIALLQDKGFFL